MPEKQLIFFFADAISPTSFPGRIVSISVNFYLDLGNITLSGCFLSSSIIWVNRRDLTGPEFLGSTRNLTVTSIQVLV